MLVSLGLSLGSLKARLLLRLARRLSTRILEGQNQRSFLRIFPWKFWLMVACMMGMGASLRASSIPRPALAPLYIMASLALLWGSRIYYSALRAS